MVFVHVYAAQYSLGAVSTRRANRQVLGRGTYRSRGRCSAWACPSTHVKVSDACLRRGHQHGHLSSYRLMPLRWGEVQARGPETLAGSTAGRPHCASVTQAADRPELHLTTKLQAPAAALLSTQTPASHTVSNRPPPATPAHAAVPGSGRTRRASLVGVWCALQVVVIEQLFDQVHVRHQHPPTAVPRESQCVQRVPAQQPRSVAASREGSWRGPSRWRAPLRVLGL